MIRKIINKYIILNIIKSLEEDIATVRKIKFTTLRKKEYIHLYISGERMNISFNFKVFIFNETVAIKYLINYREIKQEIIDKIDKKIKIEDEDYID